MGARVLINGTAYYVSNFVFRHGDHRKMAEVIIIPQIAKAMIMWTVTLVR